MTMSPQSCIKLALHSALMLHNILLEADNTTWQAFLICLFLLQPELDGPIRMLEVLPRYADLSLAPIRGGYDAAVVRSVTS